MAQYRILKNGINAARQLELEIVEACRCSLKEGVERIKNIMTLEEWELYRPELEKNFRQAFPKMLEERYPVEPRFISRKEYEDFYVENVIFCSLPGWEVNASVYRPKGEGSFPAVVCPTGHSSKFDKDYTFSAQTFARNQYIAVSFCPPGCAGELWRLNDHFENGIIGWLTGIWCQTHFLADALACLDYLETREDVDASKGFAMTGVSGGGLTSMYCGAFDKRVTFSAPVCCISDQEYLHFTGLYTSCPEQHGPGYFGKGIDMVHILSLTSPRHLMLVGGKLDTLFDYKVTEEVYRQVQNIYRLQGVEDQVELFLQEDSPHAYTVVMANRVVASMNKIFRNGEEPLPLTTAHMVHLKREDLACYPSGTVNMYTVNRDEGIKLRAQRPILEGETLRKQLAKLLHFDKFDLQVQSVEAVPESEMWRRNFHYFQNVVLHHGKDKVIPGVFAYRMQEENLPAVLYIDERGKWNPYNCAGILSKVCGYTSAMPAREGRNTFSIDVSGIGELELNHITWDATGWNDIERIVSYLSVADGTPVLAYQVRDVLLALQYLKSRKEVDASKVILAGKGLGAVIALLAGCLAKEEVEKVILLEPLAAYQCLTDAFPNSWMPLPILPNVLQYLDLPDLVADLGKKAVCINPCDEMRKPLSDAKILDYYGHAIRKGAVVKKTSRLEERFLQAIFGRLEN